MASVPHAKNGADRSKAANAACGKGAVRSQICPPPALAFMPAL
ncbi:hypothetical protein [Cognatishimia sp. F0-27]|nr:hypothetical protein [Cognatishimia sp. F0-27]